MSSVPAFTLGLDEISIGLAVDDGVLKVGPGGAMRLMAVMDLAFLLIGAAICARLGGYWMLGVVLAGVLAVDAVLRLRVSITADAREVVVRNKYRSHRFQISHQLGVRVDEVEYWFKAPGYAFQRTPFRNRWLILAIEDGNRSILCDAVMSPSPPRALAVVGIEAQPPVSVCKAKALERWVAVHAASTTT